MWWLAVALRIDGRARPTASWRRALYNHLDRALLHSQMRKRRGVLTALVGPPLRAGHSPRASAAFASAPSRSATGMNAVQSVWTPLEWTPTSRSPASR